ncbi:MAG TPA: DUF5666 domain-containing protein [Verrucomicrobiae bacterium]|jgi:hypothetical protein|nr:DUF5666 domain-containing protein [Verrucomicrobiae bacterium]
MIMKRSFVFPLIVLALTLLVIGCGSAGMTPVQMTGTMAMLQTGDAVNDQIVKFELTISSITLTGTGGTANTANLLSGSAEVEFTHEAGTFEPLSLSHIPPGTYSGATMTVSNPKVVAIVGGVATKLNATLASSTVNLTFSPNIMVGSTPLFINFDIDLPNSITISGSNATVTPTFKVSTSTVAADENNEDNNDGEIEDAHGSVTNITAPNFTIQTHSTTIIFATDSNTRFRGGLTALADLKVGDIVEVDAVTRPDGTSLAIKVEREGDHNGEEVEGVISALDSPLSKITIIHQMDSTGTSESPVTVDVAVNSSTVFSVRTDKLNVTAPPFDATHIGKGQRIEADAGNNTAPLLATKVKLREQALLGTVAASPAPTTSGFTLNVSPTSAFGTLSGVTSLPVTFANGATLKVTPTPGMNIRVRGLVFVNGTGYSMIAVLDDDNH